YLYDDFLFVIAIMDQLRLALPMLRLMLQSKKLMYLRLEGHIQLTLAYFETYSQVSSIDVPLIVFPLDKSYYNLFVSSLPIYSLNVGLVLMVLEMENSRELVPDYLLLLPS